MDDSSHDIQIESFLSKFNVALLFTFFSQVKHIQGYLILLLKSIEWNKGLFFLVVLKPKCGYWGKKCNVFIPCIVIL